MLDDALAALRQIFTPPFRAVLIKTLGLTLLLLALVSALVNFLALLLLLVPGINAIAFFAANAYLLGREFFELAALRYRPLEEVRLLRRRYQLRLFIAGLVIAAFLAVPVLNLLTPLFGTAFMVRLHKRIAPPQDRFPPKA